MKVDDDQGLSSQKRVCVDQNFLQNKPLESLDHEPLSAVLHFEMHSAYIYLADFF